MRKNKDNKRVHISLSEDLIKRINEWNKVYDLDTTAFIRLAVADKLKKEGF